MEKLCWQHTDLEVSPLAFGAMRFMGRGEDPAAEHNIKHAEKVVETCLDCGINFFDHADIYGGGNCEKVFGQVLKRHPQWRDQMVLQSKCGIRTGDSHRYDQSPRYIEEAVDGILRRLGIGHLDVLLLHRPDPLLRPEAVAEAFDRLRSAGKVNHFGVSNFSIGQMNLLQASCSKALVTNQIQLSLLHPWPVSEGVFINRTETVFSGAEGVIDFCHSQHIQVQAWSPVAGGKLSSPAASDDDRTRAVRDAVSSIASEHDLTYEGVALAWLLRHPARIIPIIGTMTPDRIRDSVRATQVEISADTWWRLFKAALGRDLP